jgi:hypothetical protein
MACLASSGSSRNGIVRPNSPSPWLWPTAWVSAAGLRSCWWVGAGAAGALGLVAGAPWWRAAAGYPPGLGMRASGGAPGWSSLTAAAIRPDPDRSSPLTDSWLSPPSTS